MILLKEPAERASFCAFSVVFLSSLRPRKKPVLSAHYVRKDLEIRQALKMPERAYL